ncbi:MAG: hypothetical protein ACTS8H_03645 [Arsenophonus sp. NC-PE1-MAG3]
MLRLFYADKSYAVLLGKLFLLLATITGLTAHGSKKVIIIEDDYQEL